MVTTLKNNPFQITTPEDLSAAEMVSLFVDEYTDLPKIIYPGHVFIKGPRGVGKSMLLRFLRPDCQCLYYNKALSELEFLGVYIPLKNTNFSLTELRRLEDVHACDILNEHLLACHCGAKVFEELLNLDLSDIQVDEARKYYHEVFIPLLYDNEASYGNIDDCISVNDIFNRIKTIIARETRAISQYLRKIAFTPDILSYSGALYDYLDFLVPMLEGLTEIKGLPHKPVYLLIDDAHCLNQTQTRVLNSWVGTRTSRRVSLKISTQYNYKTIYTISGHTIDTPHDYTEVDMATIYTGKEKSNYKDRVEKIVSKRLKAVALEKTPYEFFPVDEEQEQAIKLIGENYRKKFDIGEGRGYYRADDALRYSRPDYIKSLAGKRKSSSKYSYSGFEQLVHLSSGVIRHFLHPAYLMYAQESANKQGKLIDHIESETQSQIVRKEAEDYLFDELDKLSNEGSDNAWPKSSVEKLRNLIQGLGGIFRNILLSDKSERRVFSIALSSNVSEEVKTILDLGVQMGYFHKSTIGRKDSRSGGRTPLYVLNRRLAPIWNLDPTGFAGYLSITDNTLVQLINNPFGYLRKLSEGDALLNDEMEYIQLSIFD